jgi:hypothetical protein
MVEEGGEGLRVPVTKKVSHYGGKLRARVSNLIKSCKLQLGSSSWDSSRSEDSVGIEEPMFQFEVGNSAAARLRLGRSLQVGPTAAFSRGLEISIVRRILGFSVAQQS